MLDLKAARSRQERLVLLLDRAMLVCKVRDKPKKGGTGKGLRAKRNAPYKFKDFIMVHSTRPSYPSVRLEFYQLLSCLDN